MEEKKLIEKLEEVGSLVKAVQDKNDDLQKNYDGLRNDEIKKLGDESGKLIEEVNAMKEAKKATEEKLALLEKQASRLGKSKDEVQELQKRYTNQFARFMRKGIAIDEDLQAEMSASMFDFAGKGLSEEEIKTLQVQINPDGGYWVQPQRLSTTVGRVFETSPIRSVANVITTLSDSVEMIIDDDEATSGGWVGETEARTSTGTPKIGTLQIFAHEQYAEPLATQKMLDDAGFNIENWLAQKVSDKFTRTENTSFVVGNGFKKAKGILSYNAWATNGVYERDALEQINSGIDGNFSTDSLINLKTSLLEDYQPNAVFMMKRALWASILKLKDANGNYLINPAMLAEGADEVLLGKKIIFASDMPGQASNSLSIVYGDFGRGYTIVDRLGIRTVRDNFTLKPYTKFYTTKRTGGGVTNYEALKILKLAV